MKSDGAHNPSWQSCFIAWLKTRTHIAQELDKNGVKYFNERIHCLNGDSARRLPLYRRKKFVIIFPTKCYLAVLKYYLDIDMIMIDMHHIYVYIIYKLIISPISWIENCECITCLYSIKTQLLTRVLMRTGGRRAISVLNSYLLFPQCPAELE